MNKFPKTMNESYRGLLYGTDPQPANGSLTFCAKVFGESCLDAPRQGCGRVWFLNKTAHSLPLEPADSLDFVEAAGQNHWERRVNFWIFSW